MSEGVEFAVRLINQATGPANQIKKSVGDVTKSIVNAQRQLAAPAPRRGALSDWDKMVSRAKLSQRADFAKAFKPTRPESSKAGGGLLDTVTGVAAGNLIVDALKAVGEAALGAVIGVGKLAAEFIEAGLHAAAFAESSTKAIGYLTDNALHAGTVFDDVRHLAQGLGLEVDSTVEGFQKLLAAQFTVSQAKGLVKMSADMRAIGASAEEVQRIIYAMTEIKSMGTLQKRQERMLQMAGISGELIDRALMNRTGIKTKGGVDKARKKNLIGADVAIEAIKDAVMAKTHEHALGDVAGTRARGTLTGMLDTAKAGLENFWIDVGQKMLPGATRVATLIAGTLGKIVDDPKIAGLGQFLLARFEQFTVFIQTKWPQIESIVINGLHSIASTIEFLVETLSTSKAAWIGIGAVLIGAAGIAAGLAIVFGAIGVSIAIVAAQAIAFGAAVGAALAFVVNKAEQWYNAGKSLIDSLIAGLLAGMGPLGTALSGIASVVALTLPAGAKPVVATAPASGPTMIAPDPDVLLSSVLNSPAYLSASAALNKPPDKTEAGRPAASHSVSIGEMPIHVTAAPGEDPSALGAKVGAAVRAEVQKILKG